VAPPAASANAKPATLIDEAAESQGPVVAEQAAVNPRTIPEP
jgi:hypothetical protein